MSFLPSADLGFLPYFLLYTSAAAAIHAIVTYTHPIPGLKQFSGSAAPNPHHPLTARVYGIKNFYTSLIRLYAAYHIGNRELYDLAIATFVGVFVLYASELVVWKTVRMREGTISLITSVTGMWWMLAQRGWYLAD